MKLILHIGLPKTATSALQHLLYSTRQELLRHSILYPDEVVAYRHQFLVSAMFNGNFSAELIDKYIPTDSTVSTMILSAEGLSVHLDSFNNDSLISFRNYLKSYQQAEIFIVLRNHESWLKSYYKQCIINPVSMRVVQHETTLVFEQFINQQQVKNIVDQQRLVNQIQESYGVEVTQINYKKTVVEDLYRQFTNDINPGEQFYTAQANVSISDAAAEIARQININYGSGVNRNMLVNMLRLLDANASVEEVSLVSSQLKKLALNGNDFDRIKCLSGQNHGLDIDVVQAERLLNKLKHYV